MKNIVVAAIFGSIFIPLKSMAQEKNASFFAVELGRGSLHNPFFEDQPFFERDIYGYGLLKAGRAVSDRVLLGTEIELSARGEADSFGFSLNLAGIHAVGYYYPISDTGVFVKGGLGLSTLELSRLIIGNEVKSQFSTIVGLGLDVPMNVRFGLTPIIAYQRLIFSDGSANTFKLGLGFSWY